MKISQGKKIIRRPFEAANLYQKRLMVLIFFVMAIPLIVFGLCIYFFLTDSSLVSLNASGSVLQKILIVVLFTIPPFLTCIWIVSYIITNRSVGSLQRIIQDLDASLEGKRSGPLSSRPGDYTKDLVDRINKLLEKLPPSKNS